MKLSQTLIKLLQTHPVILFMHSTWNASKVQKFSSNASLDSLADLGAIIDNWSDNPDMETQQEINEVSAELGDTILSCAEACNILKIISHVPNKKQKINPHKPWFDKDCQRTRIRVHCLKQIYRLNRNELNRKSMLL